VLSVTRRGPSILLPRAARWDDAKRRQASSVDLNQKLYWISGRESFPPLIQIKACLRELCQLRRRCERTFSGQRENQQMNFGWFALLGDCRCTKLARLSARLTKIVRSRNILRGGLASLAARPLQPMTKRSKSQIEAAYHEAAHAVIAYLLGYRPQSVTIIPTVDTAGHIIHANPLHGFQLDIDG
jgi:hypothetical protein